MKKLTVFFSILFLSSVLHQAVIASATNVYSNKNTNGDVVAVWETFNGTDFNLAVNILPNNGSWGSSVVLGAPVQMELFPKAVINNSGNAAVIWTAVDYTYFVNTLYIAYFDGSTWSSPIALSANYENVSGTGNYQVHLSDTDWLVITWSSYSQAASDYVIRSTWGSLGGSFTGPVTLG